MYRSLVIVIFVFLIELRFALAAPTGAGNKQAALLDESESHSSVQDTISTVGLAFESTSLASNYYMEVPLGIRVSLRDHPTLPRRPNRGRIVGTYTSSATAPTVHKSVDASLDKTICMVYPRPRDTSNDIISRSHSKVHGGNEPSGKALLEKGRAKAPAAPVWWKLKDGWVDFESVQDRWYMKGLEIEAVQCI